MIVFFEDIACSTWRKVFRSHDFYIAKRRYSVYILKTRVEDCNPHAPSTKTRSVQSNATQLIDLLIPIAITSFGQRIGHDARSHTRPFGILCYLW